MTMMALIWSAASVFCLGAHTFLALSTDWRCWHDTSLNRKRSRWEEKRLQERLSHKWNRYYVSSIVVVADSWANLLATIHLLRPQNDEGEYYWTNERLNAIKRGCNTYITKSEKMTQQFTRHCFDPHGMLFFNCKMLIVVFVLMAAGNVSFDVIVTVGALFFFFSCEYWTAIAS